MRKLSTYQKEHINWIVEEHRGHFDRILQMHELEKENEDWSFEHHEELCKIVDLIKDHYVQWFSVTKKIALKWFMKALKYYELEVYDKSKAKPIKVAVEKEKPSNLSEKFEDFKPSPEADISPKHWIKEYEDWQIKAWGYSSQRRWRERQLRIINEWRKKHGMSPLLIDTDYPFPKDY